MRSSARFNDVTMTELEPVSNLREAEAEDFGFEDVPDTWQMGRHRMQENSVGSEEQPSNIFRYNNSETIMVTEVTEAMETLEVSVDIPDAGAQMDPMHSITLAERIRISRSVPPTEPPPEPERRRNRRRNQVLICDREKCIASQELIQRRNREE
ncbi:unnamed protein product [Allacma fusca]|uniref:Uncharacterized protein n=1 Tax=Allacma fusca TaxID=39272 RepID=A0A8J2JPM6_9HEXA|nr:unnamed protein product [Allacma fusca]